MDGIKNKYLIIYHKEDNDGVFSAALFYDYIINILKCDVIKSIGFDYNELSKFIKEHSVNELHEKFDNIIMTDISCDASYMKALFKEFGSNFIWCDHHAPIIKASVNKNFDSIPGIRDTGRSAILCVWKYLYDQFDEAYNEKKIPELLRILSAWDSWTYEKEEYDFEFVRDVNKGVTNKLNLDLEKTKRLIETITTYYLNNFNISYDYTINDFQKHGHLLNEYEDITMESIIKNSGDISWEVRAPHYTIHKACAIFHQGATNSTMFKCLKGTDIRHGLVFKHHPNGNWVLSMYNINDDEEFHCGEFLKEKYNGGGHKGAAGCTLTQEQFIEILKNKQI